MGVRGFILHSHPCPPDNVLKWRLTKWPGATFVCWEMKSEKTAFSALKGTKKRFLSVKPSVDRNKRPGDKGTITWLKRQAETETGRTIYSGRLAG